MGETTLLKPRAIQAFEKRFKTEAGHWGDVFYIYLASSWEDFFRSAFCFINDCSLKKENLNEAQNLEISKKKVIFNGRILFKDIWGSACLLAQGKLTTPHSLGHLPLDLFDGVYLLSWVNSDLGDYDGD